MPNGLEDSNAARYHLPQRARASGAGDRLRLPRLGSTRACVWCRPARPLACGLSSRTGAGAALEIVAPTCAASGDASAPQPGGPAEGGLAAARVGGNLASSGKDGGEGGGWAQRLPRPLVFLRGKVIPRATPVARRRKEGELVSVGENPAAWVRRGARRCRRGHGAGPSRAACAPLTACGMLVLPRYAGCDLLRRDRPLSRTGHPPGDAPTTSGGTRRPGPSPPGFLAVGHHESLNVRMQEAAMPTEVDRGKLATSPEVVDRRWPESEQRRDLLLSQEVGAG